MNWPHVQLALNHVPVLGSIFIFLLLVVGVCKRSDELKRLALQALLLLAVVSIPIKFTGDFASEQLADADATFVQRHEQTADQATTGIFITGLVALAGLIVSRRRKPVPAWATTVALVVTLATFLLLLRTAQSGGQIRHPEIRAR